MSSKSVQVVETGKDPSGMVSGGPLAGTEMMAISLRKCWVGGKRTVSTLLSLQTPLSQILKVRMFIMEGEAEEIISTLLPRTG